MLVWGRFRASQGFWGPLYAGLPMAGPSEQPSADLAETHRDRNLQVLHVFPGCHARAVDSCK